MSFRHRNALYLRISRHTVIPLYLYLDDRHTKWMTDKILTQVIKDLRPLIQKKWREELEFKDASGAKGKKFGVVDVYRGETYQLAYFLQRHESHHLLIKSRHFSSEPRRPLVSMPSKSETPELSKQIDDSQKTKAAAQKRKRSETVEDQQPGPSDPQGPIQVRRSERNITRNIPAGSYREQDDDGEQDRVEEAQASTPIDASRDDAQERNDALSAHKEVVVKTEQEDADLSALLARASPMAAEDADYLPQGADQRVNATSGQREDTMDVDEDLQKPTLTLRYDGYTIPDVCLAIIVEPYSGSASRAGTREPSAVPGGVKPSRFVGLAPPSRAATEVPDEAPSAPQKKPLFRDFTPFAEDEVREVSRFPSLAPQRSYPPVPLFHEETPGLEDDDDDGANLIQFSQAINLVGNRLAGGDGGGDEDDADALLADADDAR